MGEQGLRDRIAEALAGDGGLSVLCSAVGDRLVEHVAGLGADAVLPVVEAEVRRRERRAVAVAVVAWLRTVSDNTPVPSYLWEAMERYGLVRSLSPGAHAVLTPAGRAELVRLAGGEGAACGCQAVVLDNGHCDSCGAFVAGEGGESDGE